MKFDRRQDGIRTAGMLLRHGISKGHEPTVSVLEIGTNVKRQPSDLLPYLPEFSQFFAPLPQKASDMKLKPTTVPLSDVESVTIAHIKVNQPAPFSYRQLYSVVKRGNVNIFPPGRSC